MMRRPWVLAKCVVVVVICPLAAQAEPACAVAAANLFPVQSWLPPPPPPPPRKPEPPKAPPLPFKYLGQLQEGNEIALFLQRGELNIVVRAGETVDSVWRVEKITPTQAVFNYRPLDQSQTLTLRTRP